MFCCFPRLNAQNDSVFCASEDLGDFWKMTLVNNSKDTLFIFDTYLRDSTYNNVSFFYRYSKKQNICTIDFLPMLPYLSVHKTDLVILGNNSFVNKFQTTYQFSKVIPEDTVYYYVRKRRNRFAYKEVDYNNYSIFSESMDFKKTKLPSQYRLQCKIAIYKDITLLKSNEDYYNNALNFNKQAMAYKVLIIPIVE